MINQYLKEKLYSKWKETSSLSKIHETNLQGDLHNLLEMACMF